MINLEYNKEDLEKGGVIDLRLSKDIEIDAGEDIILNLKVDDKYDFKLIPDDNLNKYGLIHLNNNSSKIYLHRLLKKSDIQKSLVEFTKYANKQYDGKKQEWNILNFIEKMNIAKIKIPKDVVLYQIEVIKKEE
jgi:hypothetical protein